MVENIEWKEIINSIDIDLPEEGSLASLSELESPKEKSLEQKSASVLKFSFDVYLISMLESPHKHFMITSKQSMEDLGTMTIGEATQKIKRIQERRKKRTDVDE